MKHLHIQTNGFGVYPVMMHPKRETISFIAEKGQIETGQKATFSDEGGVEGYCEYDVFVVEDRPAIIAEGGKYQGCKNPHHVKATFKKTGVKLNFEQITERLNP